MEKWRSPKITEDSARLVVLTSSRWMPEVRYGKPQCRGRYSSASERDGGLEMLGKCTNPSCSASFRSLKEGRLFRLENNPTLRSCNVTTAEYFWLCSCSTMTLHLSDDGSWLRRLQSGAFGFRESLFLSHRSGRGNPGPASPGAGGNCSGP